MMMPSMGESIFECTVLHWLVKEGDQVEIDDMILEVATDKIDTEIGATSAGKIVQFLVKEGEQALIGKPICIIETEAVETINPLPTQPTGIPQEEVVAEDILKEIQVIQDMSAPKLTSASRFYSPLVMTIAQKENISQQELDAIAGTGLENRVTKHDILAYLENKEKSIAPAPAVQIATPVTPTPSPIQRVDGLDEIIDMDRMRRMIADRMVESKRTAPHVTSFAESDMTVIAQWRTKIKGKFEKETGEKLTFTPLLVEAVVKALKQFPMMNVQVDGYQIIKKKHINIGLAVALPNGNLIVPVIHQADSYSLTGLTKMVNDLAFRARNNQLKPHELQGGTYTISNIGSFGNISGTPILVQPQVGIMAFGAIVKVPAVVETPQGDMIAIRQKMILSHSYDHRVVDGSLGGQFVKAVADYLEKFDVNRTF